MANGDSLLQCYNKGCGKKFSVTENAEGEVMSCHNLVSINKTLQIHAVSIPGNPFFMMLIRVGAVAIRNAQISRNF